VCDFSAHALQTTVGIYSIDKPAKPRVFVSSKPKACVYQQYVRSSNPVGGVRHSLVGSTPAAFRHKGLVDSEDTEKSNFKRQGVGFYARNLFTSLSVGVHTVYMYSAHGSGFGSLAKQDGKRCCFTCHWWQIEYPRPRAATCLHDPVVTTHSFPDRGCAFWMRETGSDDEED